MNLNKKSFSLIEVLVTLAILSTAVISIFRSFAASLYAVKLSQNITRASYLVEEKIWEIDQWDKDIVEQENGFKFNYQKNKTDLSGLSELKFEVSWLENKRQKRALIFLTELIDK